jgi:hypothetical protein
MPVRRPMSATSARNYLIKDTTNKSVTSGPVSITIPIGTLKSDLESDGTPWVDI